MQSQQPKKTLKINVDGSVFIGHTTNKQPNGIGTLYCPNGEIYNGQFSNGIIQSGTFTYNGSTANLSILNNIKENPSIRRIKESGDNYDIMNSKSSSQYLDR